MTSYISSGPVTAPAKLEARPVRAELVAHHDAGDDAHPERDREIFDQNRQRVL